MYSDFPGGQVLYVDSNVVNGVTNDPDFLGDSGVRVEPGHYSDHPAPGVSFNLQIPSPPTRGGDHAGHDPTRAN
jgi:hypothetical protein